jgi:hypothetical protein
MWQIDENGNVVWVEGATRSDLADTPRVFGFLNPAGGLGQQILGSRAAGQSGFTAVSPDPAAGPLAPRQPRTFSAWEDVPVVTLPSVTPSDPIGSSVTPSWWERTDTRPTTGPRPSGDGIDLSGLFTDEPAGAGPGYTPSLVDTAAAEALLRFDQSPEERAALEQLLQDLDFRAEAATTAVRTGWQDVQRINAAAADKAARMAREAGPEAARMWVDAANTVLNLSAQSAAALGSTPGMQSVNISPSAGSDRIAALLAAEAPRARQLAERMGMATSEQIAAQARTAGMMGEAFAGDIQRTALIQASNARSAHNERVLKRISEERQLGAQMRFQAAQTNAQLLSTAAAAAAQGARTPDERRDRVRNLVSDVREFANIDPQSGEPRNGIAALMGIYGFDADTARNLILGARQGTLDWAALMRTIERG